jgi:hypothetical protein
MLFPNLLILSMNGIKICLIVRPILVASGRILRGMAGPYGRRQVRGLHVFSSCGSTFDNDCDSLIRVIRYLDDTSALIGALKVERIPFCLSWR